MSVANKNFMGKRVVARQTRAARAAVARRNAKLWWQFGLIINFIILIFCSNNVFLVVVADVSGPIFVKNWFEFGEIAASAAIMRHLSSGGRLDRILKFGTLFRGAIDFLFALCCDRPCVHSDWRIGCWRGGCILRCSGCWRGSRVLRCNRSDHVLSLGTSFGRRMRE